MLDAAAEALADDFRFVVAADDDDGGGAGVDARRFSGYLRASDATPAGPSRAPPVAVSHHTADALRRSDEFLASLDPRFRGSPAGGHGPEWRIASDFTPMFAARSRPLGTLSGNGPPSQRVGARGGHDSLRTHGHVHTQMHTRTHTRTNTLRELSPHACT
jgi:hypothetical protein